CRPMGERENGYTFASRCSLPSGDWMRSDTIEPKTRTLHFEKTVFICARCECEYERVYLYKGSWFCLPCLKDVLKDAGAKIYGFSWRPEVVRNAGEMKCLEFACGIAGLVSLRRVCLCRGSPSFDKGGLRPMSRVLLFALMLTATSMASFGQAAAPAKYPRVVTELHLISERKPKHALLFAEQLIPRPTIEDYEFGNAGHKVECKGESQPDFACALVFNFDPPVPDGIASVSG